MRLVHTRYAFTALDTAPEPVQSWVEIESALGCRRNLCRSQKTGRVGDQNLSSVNAIFRVCVATFEGLSKDRLFYRKTQLSSVWPIFRDSALSFDCAIFRAPAQTFERKLSFDCRNFRAQTIVRSGQLSITLERLIPPTFDSGSGGIRIPHEGNVRLTPHEGNVRFDPHDGKAHQFSA
jgi:hypothetical protein